MIDGAGAIGPRNWWGMRLRARSERWSREIVENVRTGALEPAEGTAAHVISWHMDGDGELLGADVAAVELVNVLRPTVAIGHFVMFGAMALHDHPECRQQLEAGNDDYLELFVQEVRRFYPLFPCVGGRVRKEFDWKGHHFANGTWVLLDLCGTNHDSRTWEVPETFQPERFRWWHKSAFNVVAQGGGDHHNGHRCPGESITIELMKRTMRLLTASMLYNVPQQDLRIALSRMPALPASRFVITDIRPAG